jgi:hypothetical protein
VLRPCGVAYPPFLPKILGRWYVKYDWRWIRYFSMAPKEAQISLLPRYEKGQAVRVRFLSCNRHMGESGVVVHVRLDKSGERALDKYVVLFADKDQDEFWSIQLEMPPSGHST